MVFLVDGRFFRGTASFRGSVTLVWLSKGLSNSIYVLFVLENPIHRCGLDRSSNVIAALSTDFVFHSRFQNKFSGYREICSTRYVNNRILPGTLVPVPRTTPGIL